MKRNLKIERIQKSSRAAFIVTNVIKILLIVCSGISIVAGCMVIGFRSIINSALTKESVITDLLEEDIRPSLALRNLGGSLIGNGQFAEATGVYMIVLGIILGCMAVVLHFVSKVFRDFMLSYSPFQTQIVKNLKIAFILITVFVLQSSLGYGLLIGLASWCVINIFEYGCELQRQSDETL